MFGLHARWLHTSAPAGIEPPTAISTLAEQRISIIVNITCGKRLKTDEFILNGMKCNLFWRKMHFFVRVNRIKRTSLFRIYSVFNWFAHNFHILLHVTLDALHKVVNVRTAASTLYGSNETIWNCWTMPRNQLYMNWHYYSLLWMKLASECHTPHAFMISLMNTLGAVRWGGSLKKK